MSRMNFKNTVYNRWEEPIGFRCRECNGIFQSIWGAICNGCREKERRHLELIQTLKEIAGAVNPKSV